MKEEAQTLHIQFFFLLCLFIFTHYVRLLSTVFHLNQQNLMLKNNDLTRIPPLFHVKQKTQRKIDILESIAQNEINDKKGGDHDGD
ncbi:hypothetical protein [Bacillus paralicheniformis]|uniref:hypothetical protein n=1 Tax=Bacillus paralicheniformis TaxID=1648923 RepID=UPI00186BAC73|nr:hypothetical protein [Bacillus paralicheniformis]